MPNRTYSGSLPPLTSALYAIKDEIRQKQTDGTWLIYRDIFNSDLLLPE